MISNNLRYLRYRFKYKKSKHRIIAGITVILLLSLLLVVVISKVNSDNKDYITVSTNNQIVREPSPLVLEMGKVLKLLDVTTDMKLQQIISEGCPLIVYSKDKRYSQQAMDFLNLLGNGLAYITDLNSKDPTSFFRSQMAVFASVDTERPIAVVDGSHREAEEDFYLDTPSGLEEWHFEVEKNVPVELGQDPVVLIYNSHNAETYKPTFGTSRVDGRNGGVVTVAQIMEETLEGVYGIKTIRSTTLHDYPDWSRSYINSMRTAQDLLKANPTIQAVFDIHRDAGFSNKSTTTVKIEGRDAASILIMVGTEHSRWRENLAFAQQLERKANELYPGLLRDIRIAPNRRYNQNLHPNALLLEMGSDLNTLEEAKYSMVLFSHIVAEVLKENAR